MMGKWKISLVWRRAGLLLLMLCCMTLIISASNPNTPEGFIIIAHRGASGSAPENTMAAFEQAEHLGSDFIEFDVQMSKDGELVVIHDDTVDRTTEYRGSVDDYTLRELESMNAEDYEKTDQADETIVSLEEVMHRFAGKIGMLIEIKEPTLYPGIEEKVAEVVRRYELLLNVNGLEEDRHLEAVEKVKNSSGIIIQSYDFQSTRLIHSLLPNIPIAALIQEDQHPLSEKTLDELVSFAAYIHYNHELLDEKIVQQIHHRNRKVMAWTIRTEQDMKRMKKLGVDGVITDFPG
jgi:glycerophosphoryl diester phosphodiesterase